MCCHSIASVLVGVVHTIPLRHECVWVLGLIGLRRQLLPVSALHGWSVEDWGVGSQHVKELASDSLHKLKTHLFRTAFVFSCLSPHLRLALLRTVRKEFVRRLAQRHIGSHRHRLTHFFRTDFCLVQKKFNMHTNCLLLRAEHSGEWCTGAKWNLVSVPSTGPTRLECS